MRIAELRLTEIGPFDDAVLAIPPPDDGQAGELILFEGPNGSGKTTLAQAIACAAAFPPADVNSVRATLAIKMLSGDALPSLGPPVAELVERIRSGNGVVMTTF